jgi:hypothetical protein
MLTTLNGNYLLSPAPAGLFFDRVGATRTGPATRQAARTF